MGNCLKFNCKKFNNLEFEISSKWCNKEIAISLGDKSSWENDVIFLDEMQIIKLYNHLHKLVIKQVINKNK